MNGPLMRIVEDRLGLFKRMGSSDRRTIFKELCFCILTANYDAERAIYIQNAIDDGFLSLSEDELRKKLRELGYRFPVVRARYIVIARIHIDDIFKLISLKDDAAYVREWLAKNIKGIGYKEASHFLRNMGYMDVAIIDFHILDLLARYRLIVRPRSLSKRRYMEIEQLLRDISEELGITLSELDLYLWYLETGKILK